MKIYQGIRTPEGNIVTVDGVDLPRPPKDHDVVEVHDWEWGYRGAGPMCLAEAILHDFFHDLPSAQRLAPAFLEVIAEFPEDQFELTEDEVGEWVKKKVGKKHFGWNDHGNFSGGPRSP